MQEEKEFDHDRNGWILPRGTVLTIEKITDDGMTLWFKENCMYSEEIISYYQFWEAKNFELIGE